MVSFRVLVDPRIMPFRSQVPVLREVTLLVPEKQRSRKSGWNILCSPEIIDQVSLEVLDFGECQGSHDAITVIIEMIGIARHLRTIDKTRSRVTSREVEYPVVTMLFR